MENKANILEYILSGNATFTVETTNPIHPERYTYKMRKNKLGSYDCFVLYGPDNLEDYKYMGTYYDSEHKFISHTRHSLNSFVYNMFYAFLSILYSTADWPKTCKFYKSKRCARCGRLLTTPESIESGYGPQCRKGE